MISELDGKYLRKMEGLKWFLVMTMPRVETKAEAFFKNSAIPCYLPKISRRYINRFKGKNGRDYSYVRPAAAGPMFPGYIFAALDLDTLTQTRCQRTIARVCLHSNYNEDELLADLRKVQEFEFLAQHNQVEVKTELAAGTPIAIKRGLFKGWEGVVERRLDNNFIFVRISSVEYFLGISCAAVDCEVLN